MTHRFGRRKAAFWRSCISAGTLALAGALALAQKPASPQAPPGGGAGAVAFFESRVRPILVSCEGCHGEGNASGNLRLDRPITPAQAAEVVARVKGLGGKERMPQGSPALGREQIASLETWAKSGAPFPASSASVQKNNYAEMIRTHWAFQKVKRPAVPMLANPVLQDEWVRSPIDSFVGKKLESKGLTPNFPASKRELIRRVTYDLTGLPPTPEEVEAYATSTDPNAYEKLVDRLLASPHYGEKWGRQWLDLVRYAETNSYERDNPKPNAFRYRDYVIKSLNADKPYDRFVTEQLAGDELPDADNDSRTATGFYRLGIWDDEPTDREQARYDSLDDVVTTVGQTFLGLTFDCARCHNHKIDPIPQKDYYQLVSFFQGTNHFRNGGPTDEAPLFSSAAQKTEYEAKVADLERRRSETQKALSTIDDEFRGKYLAASGAGGDLADLRYRYYRDTFLKLPDFDALKPEREGDVGKPYLDIALRDRNQAFGFVFTGTLVVPAAGEYTFLLDSDDGSRLTLDGKKVLEYDGIHGQGSEKTAKVTLPAGRVPFRLDYFQNIFGLGLSLAWEGPGVSRRPLASLDSSGPGADIGKLIETNGAKVLGAERMAERMRLQKKLEALRNESVPVERALIVTEGGRTCPETFVLGRGSAAAPGDRVAPKFPDCLGGGAPAEIRPTENTTGRRFALAKWIASPGNPQTARVMANRLWQGHFGRGIVRTPNDFGFQGTLPTHPELLDWLASELVAKKWSLKAMHRLIVTSSSYRMSSRTNPVALAKDPQNDLFWRFDMRRLTAEELRDSVLAATGTLNAALFGPSVYPDIPDEVLQGQSQPGKDWYPDRMTPADKCRRSVYIFQKRSLRFPMLDAFDLAESDRTTAVRFSSTQPTQALGMLNSGWIQEQAALLATRVKKEAGDSAAAQVKRALALTMQRPPTEREIARGVALIDRLEKGGESPAIARQRFCLVALNLDEFFYLD